MTERRLGRGLDFFLSSPGGEEAATAAAAPQAGVRELPIDALVPNPFQPRRDFAEAELRDLAASIRSAGLLQPILVRKIGGRHQIVAGERRWRAARTAGLANVPVLVRDLTDEQTAIFGLVENLHREDLNPIEKARAFKRIQQMSKASQEEIAKQVGLERSTVANFLRLLELPVEVQAHVSRGTLSMGQARAILSLADDTLRTELAERAIRDRLSVRQLEALAAAAKAPTPEPSAPGAGGTRRQPEQPLWLKEIEDTLTEALEATVQVRYGRKRSKIVIECEGRAEFERVYEQLKQRRS